MEIDECVPPLTDSYTAPTGRDAALPMSQGDCGYANRGVQRRNTRRKALKRAARMPCVFMILFQDSPRDAALLALHCINREGKDRFVVVLD